MFSSLKRSRSYRVILTLTHLKFFFSCPMFISVSFLKFLGTFHSFIVYEVCRRRYIICKQFASSAVWLQSNRALVSKSSVNFISRSVLLTFIGHSIGQEVSIKYAHNFCDYFKRMCLVKQLPKNTVSRYIMFLIQNLDSNLYSTFFCMRN